MERFTTVNEAPDLRPAAPQCEEELRRVQILLGLRAYKTELCLLALALRIQYLKYSSVPGAIALPGELEAVLSHRQRLPLSGQVGGILTQRIEHVGDLSKRLQDSLLVALRTRLQFVDRGTSIGAVNPEISDHAAPERSNSCQAVAGSAC